MTAFMAPQALLPDGWATDVRLEVDPGGTLALVQAGGTRDGAQTLPGPILPGICDLHCHAFQRAMAGLTEVRTASEDSFWTWREVMYRFAARITPEDLEAIATQLYIELLKGGFTSVCEFHYLHNDPAGRPYANRAEMSERLARAAAHAGIGLTLLPVLYVGSNFGGVAPRDEQRRFVSTPESLLRMIEALKLSEVLAPATCIGVAPHSLRAVTPEALRELLLGVDRIDARAPVHIHVAEQSREVEDCLAWSGKRPVEWLLEHCDVSARWCLVHATHLSPRELGALAGSRAVVGLCPTTEANLGDGLFSLVPYLGHGGAFGVGSDSNVSVSPIEELRWLEYGQRLVHRRRGIAATEATPSPGLALYQFAVAGGATASGRPVAGLAPGQRADFVVIDDAAPVIAERDVEHLVDAIVFAGNTSPIRDVYVGGQRVIEHGRHAGEGAALAAYRSALRRITAAD